MLIDQITFGSTVRRLDVPGAVLTETMHPAGMELPRHEHANPNVNFLLWGAFGERAQRRDFSCRAGSVLAKPGGASHSNRYGEHRARSLVVEFCPTPADPVTGGREDVVEVWYTEDPTVAALGWRLYGEMLEPDRTTPLAIGELLTGVLGRVATGRKLEESSATQPRWLRRVRERLDAAGDEQLRELSLEAGVHPRHLMRAFRRYLGCSMGEYARRGRIRRAQRLLAETPMGLAAVAAEAGFCDQSHFTRVFKRSTGMKPGQYRGLMTTLGRGG